MRRIAIFVVVAVGLLSALGGTAAANGGSGSATACFATSTKTVETKFLVNLYRSTVDPSQKQFATCAFTKKVAGRVASLELKAPEVVDRFRCTVHVLKSKPARYAYNCVFEGGETATEIKLSFTVGYLEDSAYAGRAS